MTIAKIKSAVIAAIFILLVLAGGTIAFQSWRKNQPAAIQPISAGSSLWPLQFGQTRIVLSGISDPQNPDGAWWLPDGTPTAAPIAPRRVRPLSPGGSQAWLSFSSQNLDTSDDFWPEAKGIGDAEWWVDYGNPPVHNMIFRLSPGQVIADIEIHFAGGPWAKVVTYDIASPNEQAAKFLGISSVGGDLRQTIVKANLPTDRLAEDWLVIVRTNDGKEIAADKYEGTKPDTIVLFPCPKDQAKQIVYRSRPYITKHIQNVSLQAGYKTHPRVVDSPTTRPTTNPS